jgi:ribosomal protein L11 methyltransferase
MVAIAGAADYALASRGFTLPLVYVVPVGVVIWLAPGRLVLVTSLLSALANFAVDSALAPRLANPTTVHLLNTAFMGILLLLGRAGYVARLMSNYYQRGEAWKLIYQPARIGERFVVVPTWLEQSYANDPNAPRAEFVLVIDPGKAFGTGSHPTTQLCVALMERFVRPGDRVLDLGCGSGILSLVAARLGASAVLGLDIDPEAVRVSAANAAANDAGQLEFRLGSLDLIMPRGGGDNPPQFDLVVNNVLTDFDVAAIEYGLPRALAPGGRLILSGIRADPQETTRVEAAIAAAGLELLDLRQDDKWAAVAAQRKE